MCKKKIRRWINNAKPWHFWNPGSEQPGGMIAGLLIGIVLLVILFSCQGCEATQQAIDAGVRSWKDTVYTNRHMKLVWKRQQLYNEGYREGDPEYDAVMEEMAKNQEKWRALPDELGVDENGLLKFHLHKLEIATWGW